MEEVYDDLENFTEETTNAELREENKELKIKLEEYAKALDQLQINILQEFDMLVTEHKKLELNYSSLLKTAKSEIERKTQTITKLNIEKDAMVLSSIQNRNSPHNRQRAPNRLKANNEEPLLANKKTQFSRENVTKPCQVSTERKGDTHSPDVTSHKNIQTRLLDLVNKTAVDSNINSSKNSEVKENIKVKDGQRSGARITCRRKSMPVFSMDSAKFSTDEEDVASSGSFKEFVTKEQPDYRYLDRHSDKPRLEEKLLKHQEHSKETKSRYSRHDSDKFRKIDNHKPVLKYRRNQSSDRGRRSPDRRKVSPERRKASPERKRGSPDRYRKEVRNHSEEYKRQEYERRRRLASPPKDKHYYEHRQRSRDSQRSNERHNLQDYKPRSQDMYAMKHKIVRDYEEPSGKRMRLDSHHKHDEDRWRNEKQVSSLPVDLDHVHNMSCQSPDQSYLETHPSHQTKEIKLIASTHLEDPRLSSKKYSLKTHDGKAELTTVDSNYIEVKVIDTSNWDMIKTIKMPNALLEKPTTSDIPCVTLLQKPMTAGLPDSLLQRTSDLLDASLQKQKSSEEEHTLIQNPTPSLINKFIQNEVSPVMPEIVMPETLNYITDSLIKKPITTHVSDILAPKSIPAKEIIPEAKITTSTDDLVKDIYMDVDNPMSNITMDDVSDVDDFEYHDENNTHHTTRQHKVEPLKADVCKTASHPKISNLNSDDIQNDNIGKDMFSLDNDMFSLDNDNHNPKLKNNTVITSSSEETTNEASKKRTSDWRSNEGRIQRRRTSELQYQSNQNYITAKGIIEGDLELSDEENSDNNDVQTIKGHSDANDVSLAPDVMDTKKPKTTKKSLKLNELHENKVTPSTEKPNKKKEDNIKEPVEVHDTSLSMDQLIKMKEEITNELVVTKNIKLLPDKPDKKKANKLKVPSKNKEVSMNVDKPDKKKETQPKEIFENRDTVLNVDKLVKKKENKPKELHVNKETAAKDRPVKKRERHPKEPVNTDIIPSEDQPVTEQDNILEFFEKKDTAVMDKPVKKKEKLPKELSTNKYTLPSMEKPVQRKENITNENPPEKKETVIDKPLKKKEIKRKDFPEHQNAQRIDKPAKKKQNKTKDLPEKNAANKDVLMKGKEYKPKETQFRELFGDSSSLVSPEDLGLVPAVVAPPEDYVAMFEDAQDASDMDSIRATVTSAPTNNARKNKVDTQSSFALNVECTKPVATFKPDTCEPSSDATINNPMYKNLQSNRSLTDTNVVKTVIISSGIQPQCTSDATESYPIADDGTNTDFHVMQCVKPSVIQDIALQALATSTPHKLWHQNVQAEHPTISETRCSNGSCEVIDEVPLTENTSTGAPQNNDADEPDVTIFVKRRRKVVKKK